MLGDGKQKGPKEKFGTLTKLITCLSILSFAIVMARSQVIIVPGKTRGSATSTATGTSNKVKQKSKPKGNPSRLSPDEKPISNLSPRPESTLKPMAFVVVRPTLQPISARDIGRDIGKSFGRGYGMTAGGNLMLPKILDYEFEVINADERGRVSDRRPETARYFAEDLGGGVQIDMVDIPGGTFMMGSLETEIESARIDYVRGIEKEIKAALTRRLIWETPQHMVAIPGFYMSKFEITQAQWRAVAALPKVNRDLMSDPSHFKGSNKPVEKVSWEDALEFCERLSRATGRRYRLPSEAEWEYACRAGTSSVFHYGNSMKTDWANFNGKYSYGSSPKGNNREQTVPVGSLGEANAFGLYDMHGNVWEWCLDTWHDNYASAPEDNRPWDTNGIIYLKLLRGGAFDSSAGECRSGSRNRMTSTIRLNNIGFRVVVEIPAHAPTSEASISLK